MILGLSYIFKMFLFWALGQFNKRLFVFFSCQYFGYTLLAILRKQKIEKLHNTKPKAVCAMRVIYVLGNKKKLKKQIVFY